MLSKHFHYWKKDNSRRRNYTLNFLLTHVCGVDPHACASESWITLHNNNRFSFHHIFGSIHSFRVLGASSPRIFSTISMNVLCYCLACSQWKPTTVPSWIVFCLLLKFFLLLLFSYAKFFWCRYYFVKKNLDRFKVS